MTTIRSLYKFNNLNVWNCNSRRIFWTCAQNKCVFKWIEGLSVDNTKIRISDQAWTKTFHRCSCTESNGIHKVIFFCFTTALNESYPPLFRNWNAHWDVKCKSVVMLFFLTGTPNNALEYVCCLWYSNHRVSVYCIMSSQLTIKSTILNRRLVSSLPNI